MIDADSNLISVGMPIRNEARYLRAALDALTSQMGVEMELIISDNASTDDTPLICREYCARYPWISYHRFEENVGAAANFIYVLEQARGKYFMWASGHDLWDRNFLQECSGTLDNAENAVVAFGTTRWIDADGNPYPRVVGWSDTRGLSVVGRYFTVFWGNMNPILGLMRTRNLKSQRMESMAGNDLAVLLGLALEGDFIHAQGASWSRREFRHEASYSQKLARYRSADYALTTSLVGRLFPLARLPLRILGDLFASRLKLGKKLLIASALLPGLLAKYLVDKSRRPVDAGRMVVHSEI